MPRRLRIDGQKKGLDDQHFLQRFTPRRARGIWSKINVDKVAALIEAARMQAPGYAQIEAAKADGRWARAYDGARTSAVLWRIQAAVKAETRVRRIAQLVEMRARGETIHFVKPGAKA